MMVVAGLALAACGDGDNATDDAGSDDAGSDTSADVTDTSDSASDVPDVPVEIPPRPEGVTALFDISLSNAGADAFYNFPFPSDLRRDADGTISMAGFPNPNRVPLVAGLVAAAEESTGFSSLSAAFFRFEAPVSLVELEQIEALNTAPILIVDIDPESSQRGQLIPAWARTMPAETYTPANTIGVSPRPGFVLRPDTTYAYVVLRSLGDADGTPLGVPADLWTLSNGGRLDGERGQAVTALYAPLWETLAEIGVSSVDVAAATVFSTADVVSDLFALSEALRERYSPSIAAVEVAEARGGADHERYCEIHAEIEVPQFQVGTPPFDTEGLFAIGDDGLPIEQRTEVMPIVITLPKQEMPAEGWPMVLYFHGSGGIATQVVDRGPIPGPGQGETPGEGPAHVLALHGLAAIGSAHPLSPDRLRGATSLAYLNFANLAAFRDTFRQGAIEQRLLLDALLELEIAPGVVAACDGLTLPSGADVHRFDAEPIMAMGQSMGGMYTNMIGSIEPRIRAVVPTGAGGYWSYMLPITDLVPGLENLLPAVVETEGPITYMHPVLVALQNAWEYAEPLVYVRRLAQSPLPGHPVRSIYEPAGEGDSYFDPEVYDAMALGYRHQQAGELVWQSMQDALRLVGLDGLIEYPVSENLTAEDGTTAYTGVVVQYAGDGFTDPHSIFAQYDEVKHQYGCFFETYYRFGRAVVPAPAAIGTDCDE